jgi:hypothetical protein
LYFGSRVKSASGSGIVEPQSKYLPGVGTCQASGLISLDRSANLADWHR